MIYYDHGFSKAYPSQNHMVDGYDEADEEEIVEEEPEIDVYVAVFMDEKTGRVHQKIVTQYEAAFDRLVKKHCIRLGFEFTDKPSQKAKHFGPAISYRFPNEFQNTKYSYLLVLLHDTVVGKEYDY